MNRAAIIFLLVLSCGCAPARPPASHHLIKPPAAVEDGMEVYFSPLGGAMAAILDRIGHAKKTVDVEAYLITAPAIVEALQAAQDRGVAVRIVLDKSGPGAIFSMVAYLSKTRLQVWHDGQHKDMHDKIMLIDGKIIITGSFNFTDQSEDSNGENLLVIQNKPALFQAYQADFENHLQHSDPPAVSKN